MPDFSYLKKLYSDFDLDKQVYWNYFFNLEKKTLKDWWAMYGKHKSELFSRIIKLPRYDSVHYNKYLETLQEKERLSLLKQEQMNKEIEERIAKQMKDKEEKKLILDVEKFFKNVSYFRLYSKQSKCYISYASIANYVFYIPKGFNLVSDISNLFLKSMDVDVKSG